MNTDITLLILAAGMGSRFGGLKQVEPMGPNGEFIIDYSIYDAIKAGFNKVVFLIKEENYELFKETIGSRVEPYINTEYCFQKNDNINIELPKDRVKPLGTAHAVLCCENKIHEPFMMINADDFYGQDAFIKGAEFLRNNKNDYGMIAYKIKNTLTENGSVKRGVCEVENDDLLNIIESKVEKINGDIVASPLDGRESFKVEEDRTVSMNMLLFNPTIFSYIESKLDDFLNKNMLSNSLDSCEFLIPDVLVSAIKEDYVKTKVINTSSTWYGVTYKEDTDFVKEALLSMHQNNIYPPHLWDEEKKKIKK